MSDPIDALKPEVEQWAEMVIAEFRAKLILLKIGEKGKEGTLYKSLYPHVKWHSGNDLNKVEFFFEFYGKFVDMGVGNGVNLGNRDALISAELTTRRPKKWYSDTFYKQVGKLRSLISRRTARNIQLLIVRNVRDTGDLKKPMQL